MIKSTFGGAEWHGVAVAIVDKVARKSPKRALPAGFREIGGKQRSISAVLLRIDAKPDGCPRLPTLGRTVGFSNTASVTVRLTVEG